MADYKLDFDTQTVSFTEGEDITFSGGGVAELVLYYDNDPEGEMYMSMISGAVPADGETISGATGAAVVDGTPFLSRFPVHIRDDISYNAGQDIRWSGGLLGHTHSCKFDSQTVNLTIGHIITFSGGSIAELIAQTDGGATGEILFRMISVDLPVDGETFLDEGTGNGTVDGVVHVRAYTPNNLHYWFSDKGDDSNYIGDDVHDRTLPKVSERIGVTDVKFLGLANIDDALSYHLYGGSIQQSSGAIEYNAVAVAIVDVDGNTEPVIIQDNALHSATATEYWNNAYMPNSASVVNMLIKVKDTTVTDRRVVRFRALEEFRNYFTAPDPTLGGGITPVSLVATDDGNHTADASGFLATAAYGYQTVDHNNSNGAQPYWMVISDNTDSKTSVHERFKWEQRRGTATTVLGLNAQLIVGNDLTFNFDGEAGVDIAHGDILTFSGNSTGTALVLAILYDDAVSGKLYCQRLTGDAPLDNAVITSDGTGTAVVNGTPVTRLIINNLVGGYTGSAFNPANIGVTLAAADADTSDLFTDLLIQPQKPPNNQTGAVNTAIGNTVTVFPWDGVSQDAAGDREPDFSRLTSSATYSGAAVTSITVNEAIPTWTPTTGFLRLTLASGIVQIVAHSAWTGSTFTITSTNFSDNLTSGNGVMPAPIDEKTLGSTISFTGVYTVNQDKAGAGDQEFVVTVKNGSGATPKQPSSNLAEFGSGGFSLNVTLSDD